MSATLVKAKVDFEITKRPQAREIDVGEASGEKRIPVEDDILEEPPPPAGIAALIPKEHLSVITEATIETVSLTELPVQTREGGPSGAGALLADVSFPQIDEAGPSEAVTSLVIETVSESLQIRSGEFQDVASSSGIVSKLLVQNSASIFVLTVSFSLSWVISLTSIEVVDTNIVLDLAADPHATAVGIFLRQFRTFLKEAMSSLLHDLPAFEALIAMLDSLASSIQRFDASFGDRIKQTIARL